MVCNKPSIRYGKSAEICKPKFCSLKCRGIGQTKGLTTHKPTVHKRKCQFCGKVFMITHTRKIKPNRGKYCSKKCHNEAQKRKPVSRSKKNYKRIEIMRNKISAKCIICGFRRFIEIAHIIPACKGGTYDNKNILFFCPNHHRLFDNHKLFKREISKLPISAQKIYYKRLKIYQH